MLATATRQHFLLRKSTVKLARVFVVFVFILCSVTSYAQLTTESDSAIIARHVHEMKVEYAIEEFSDHSFNAQYSDHDLDSILAESRRTVACGRVIYAPDSTFKIVVVEGEACAEHCYKLYETWLHFNDGSGMMLANAGFENVTAIEKLHDGKYLVWEQMEGISGSHGMYETAVTLLAVADHEVNYIPFPLPPSKQSDESKNPHGTFRLYQIFDDSVKLTVDFNPETNQLSYRYIPVNFNFERSDIYSGYFVYIDGAFVLKEETAKPYTE